MVDIGKDGDEIVLSCQKKEVRFPRFPYDEFKKRLARVRELMGKYGIDAVLLFAPENLYYYTGFKKENLAVGKRWRRSAIIPKDGEPVMLMGNEVFFNATITSWVEDIRGWGGPPELGRPQNFIEAYIQVIRELDLHQKVLGMEIWEDSPAIEVDLTYLEFEQLRKRLPDAKIVDAADLIWEQRMVKTPFEIQIIREVASITTKSFISGLNAVQEGISEKDVVRQMYRVMIAEGRNNNPIFIAIPVKGPGHYHAEMMGPHDTVLKKGDMLQFAGGPCHKGYWTDVQRNVCIGEPPILQRKLYDAALEAQQAAMGIIKPGVTAGDVYKVATEKLMSIDPKIDINRCGYIGHGLGLHPHEPPFLVPSGKQADIVLKEGMYLSIKVSAFDTPKFRVVGGYPGDDILVAKDGYENLTKGIPNHLWVA